MKGQLLVETGASSDPERLGELGYRRCSDG